MRIRNFGRNLEFTPAKYYEPSDTDELLEILDHHRGAKIRVVASKHSWSDAILSEDVLISMKNFRQVEVIDQGDSKIVRVGAGCQIKHLIAELQKQNLTLPSIGLITEQTIAGATSTGTHGSGKHSLSHYVQSLRVAGFHRDSDQATIRTIDQGDELSAARCALGCLGVVVSVDLPCIPQYNVLEKIRSCNSVEEALESEKDWPLQQFFLIPYGWKYLVQERVQSESPRSFSAALYRIYWWLGLDIIFHLVIKLFAVLLRSRWLVHLLYKVLLPTFVIKNWRVVDRSDRMLKMEHEMFRHLELEGFVKKDKIVDALRFVETVLKQADGSLVDQLDETLERQLSDKGLLGDFRQLKNSFTHHYPVCVRRILCDDTMISMAAGDSECWYSLSFITYRRNREDFFQLATFLAKSFLAIFDGRIHWGKWFPLDQKDIEQMYPRLPEFRKIVEQYDPAGTFQNNFTQKICQSVLDEHNS